MNRFCFKFISRSILVCESTLQHKHSIYRDFANYSKNMKPTLYYDDRSPPVRSCLMLIDYLKIDLNLKFIDIFKGEQYKNDFIKVNPAHTVPTLQHDELILTDSHSILMYLCDHFIPEDKNDLKNLFPTDNILRLKVIDKLLFECSILFRRDSDVMSSIIRQGFKNIDFNSNKKKILEAYSILEKFLSEQKYIAGNIMTIADFSIITTLSTLNLIFPVTAEEYPQLYRWFEEMKLLPSFIKCNPKGLDNLKDALEKFGDFKIADVN